MHAYESEFEALALLESKHCGVAVVTAIRARDYVLFGGSLDAIGGIRNARQLELLLSTLTSPTLRPLLSQDDFEIAAVLPVGPMYAFVNDRKIADIDRLKQKTISALNADIQTKKLAEVVGARAVNSTLTNFADQFKRRTVDVVLMPALAYTAFELEQTLRQSGGVIDIRFFNGMHQAIARQGPATQTFAKELRRYMLSRLDDIFELIETAENEIPDHYWIRSDAASTKALEAMFKDIRLELMIEEQLDRRALKLLWRIRCKIDSLHEECIG